MAKPLRKNTALRLNSRPTTAAQARLLAAPGEKGMPHISDGVERDRQLVDDCLAQHPVAWTRLYQACHPPLLATIRSFFRDLATDANLVDEIAARVWYALVRNDGELLSRFDITRGCRLSTFLSVLAKNEARQYFRSERRRRNREQLASRHEAEVTDPIFYAFASEKEFLGTLTPGERVYYENVLVAVTQDEGAGQYSPENSWQLRRRVRIKLDRYLDCDD